MNAPQSIKGPGCSAQSDRLRRLAHRPCKGHQKLMRWQMAQYRKAVDEQQRYLSRLRRQQVRWAEAEQVFCEEQYPQQAVEWRSTYCSRICEHRIDCPLAKLFYHAA